MPEKDKPVVISVSTNMLHIVNTDRKAHSKREFTMEHFRNIVLRFNEGRAIIGKEPCRPLDVYEILKNRLA